MKYLILILNIIFTLSCLSQVSLKFDKRFVECEDKWVAFPMSEDSNYSYGFIYIDEQAGLTFNNEGYFKIKDDHSIAVEKMSPINMKIKLEANNVKVAVIPENMYKDLQIESTPDWLKYYKTDTGTVKRLYKWGYMYNGWNECEKALTFLRKAREKDPKFDGLSVELAYSYNCLKEYGQAESILEEEIKSNPSNSYVNKEYIYALTKNKKIDKASQQYYESSKTLKDKQYNAENCFNIMQYFYTEGDKKNFNIWYKELSRCTTNNKLIFEYADKMKKTLK